jgi:acyl transferase domain-containing protein/SAM-dependent methyltransferase/acyl carrier protein
MTMSAPFPPETATLSPLKRAVLTIEALQNRLAQLERPEPVAVIGLGCRFPGGVDGPEAFWRLLLEGRSGIIEVPSERWSQADWYDPDRDAPGKLNMRRGGFLSGGIDGFDAGFFGIAPREAASMDPQQRLLLEVAWETLEHAALAPRRLAGSRTGVFVGLYNNHYTLSGRGSPAPQRIDGWSASGVHTSIAAGRLSYLLDLKGPSLAVDTACSSSLVAVHLALRSLQTRESDLALAGGVHLLLSPEALVASTKLGATAADGYCKPFDARADGFGHGEGCGLVALQRLSDALAEGNQVLAVIRGSAVNQDGRSNSLTAPNGPAQEAVIRAALDGAGLDGGAVSYVEAHGTGTSLGDPIEIEALASVLGARRSGPLMVGSVKGNLGHMEAAAGVAGLIKAVLCAAHRLIPPQLGFSTLNPDIDPAPLDLVIPRQPTPWVGVEGRHIAGVSAFGFGGTNAHVILEAPPTNAGNADKDKQVEPPITWVLPLSAAAPGALAALAQRWAKWLASAANANPLEAIVHTAGDGRDHFAHRLAVTASDRIGAARALPQAAVCAPTKAPRVAFLFSGQGTQYPGMARRAYQCFAVFRDALHRFAEVLDPLLGRSTLECLFGADAIDDTALAQPLVVALELALAELWRAWGIVPAAVMGHSLGEYAAAAVAGVFTPEEALALAAARGRLMQTLPPGGAMLAIFAPLEQLQSVLNEAPDGLDLAAVNGPLNTVVSGSDAALRALEQRLSGQRVECRRLAVSHAFHSALLEPILPALEQAAAVHGVRQARLPLISNLTGTLRETFEPDYWRQHARCPVRFADGLSALRAQGCDVFVEIGPHAVLTSLGRADSASNELWLASLRRGVADDVAMAEALAGLYRAGADVDWRGVTGAATRPFPVAAPTYPFQRRRHWLDLPPPVSRPEVLSPVVGADSAPCSSGAALVYDFYDELTLVSRTYADPAQTDLMAEGHLTFGLLAEPAPGFSWVRALFEKDEDADAHALLRSSQRALKDSLFAGIDFSRIRRVFDYGCGHAADLCNLAMQYPQLELQGYTLSKGQVEVGRARIERLNLKERVRIQRNDSSAVPFPGSFDLIFGFEVTGLIENKAALFDNIAAHLAPAGLLIIADFVASGDAIANPDTHSFTPDISQWAMLFAQRHLRLTRAIDASMEVANWLDDPDTEAHVADLAQRFGLGPLTCRHLISNANIGKALRLDVMRYLLLTAQPSPHETQAVLREANTRLLGAASSYREAFPSGSLSTLWSRWLYGIDWVPLARIERAPSPRELARQVAPVVARERAALLPFAEAGRSADRLSLSYTLAAFRELGCVDLNAAVEVAVAPPFERLRNRLVAVMAEAAIDELPDPGDLEAAAVAALARHPEAAAELTLLHRCGGFLAQVLRGRQDPLELLFPAGDTQLAERLYAQSPFSQAVQRLAAEVLAQLPRQRAWSVMEIGGGTGATTAALLPQLPPGSRYLFTDMSVGLVERVKQRLVDPALEFAVVDVARPLDGQGVAVGRWDLVVAANVLHATPDLTRSLGHVRELLAPGGLLLLIENTGRLRWADLTFGLTEGMWNFTDTGLRDYALLYQKQWLELLPDCGFEEVSVLTPGEADQGGLSQQCVILARRPPCRHWLLMGGESEFVSKLAGDLAAAGHQCSRAGLDIAEAAAWPAGVSDMVYLPAMEVADPLLQEKFLAPVLGLAQRLSRLAEAPRLHLVTRGAQAVNGVAQVAQASLLGFGRALAGEMPGFGLRIIDVDPAASVAAQAAMLAAELSGGRDGEVALRGRRRLQPHLVRLQGGVAAPLRCAGDGSYLVTGAFGGLGRKVTAWLIAQGARALVLTGRKPPGAEDERRIQAWGREGIRIAVRSGDIAERSQVAQLIKTAQGLAPLRGVLHVAGALADASLGDQTWQRFEQVLAAKVLGSWHLHQLTAALALDHFVLFSSAAGLLGPAGQTNHAAANSFLDALAHMRRARGLPALAIDWGAWAEVGAAVRDALPDRVLRSGLAYMAPDQALAALAWAMRQGLPQIAILDMDWARYGGRFPHGAVPALLPDEVRASTPPGEVSAAPVKEGLASWRDQLSGASAAGRMLRLLDLIRAEAARIMGLEDLDMVTDERPLRELGLDSLMAIEMRNALATQTGEKLPATLLFDCPSINALAASLAQGALAELFRQAAATTDSDDLAGLDATALSALLDAELGGTP